MRPVILSLLCAAAMACSSHPIVTVDAGTTDIGPTTTCGITLQPAGAIVLTPSEQVNLRALVNPLGAGTTVHFGLLGTALDGSLTAGHAVTDASGTASVSLLAPSAATSFRVRADVDCGAVAYLDVSVGNRGFGTVAGTATYHGAWQPAGLTVSLVQSPDCASVGAMTADRVATLPVAGGTADFSMLPAGLDFVLVGAAVGSDGSQLAAGCTGPLTVLVSQTVAAVVALVDNPVTETGTFDIALGFDLSAEGTRAAPLWTAPVAAAIATAGGDALLIEGDVADAVASAAPGGGGAAARAAFNAAFSDHLAAQVSALLAHNGTSVTGVFSQFAANTAAIVSDVHCSAVLTVGQGGEGADGGVADASGVDGGGDGGVGPAGEGAVGQIQYTLDPATPDTDVDDVSVLVAGSSRGRFVSGMGSTVDVVLDAFPLPYARLATAAEGALAARIGVASASDYVALAVCPAIVPLLIPATGACDAACVMAACHTAIGRAGVVFDAAIAGTDAMHVAADLDLHGMAQTLSGTLSLESVAGTASGAFQDDPTLTIRASLRVTGRGAP